MARSGHLGNWVMYSPRTDNRLMPHMGSGAPEEEVAVVVGGGLAGQSSCVAADHGGLLQPELGAPQVMPHAKQHLTSSPIPRCALPSFRELQLSVQSRSAIPSNIFRTRSVPRDERILPSSCRAAEGSGRGEALTPAAAAATGSVEDQVSCATILAARFATQRSLPSGDDRRRLGGPPEGGPPMTATSPATSQPLFHAPNLDPVALRRQIQPPTFAAATSSFLPRQVLTSPPCKSESSRFNCHSIVLPPNDGGGSPPTATPPIPADSPIYHPSFPVTVCQDEPPKMALDALTSMTISPGRPSHSHQGPTATDNNIRLSASVLPNRPCHLLRAVPPAASPYPSPLPIAFTTGDPGHAGPPIAPFFPSSCHYYHQDPPLRQSSWRWCHSQLSSRHRHPAPQSLPAPLTFASNFQAAAESTSPPQSPPTPPTPPQDERLRRRSCHNCGTLDTPSWRRCPESGQFLCNACGLYRRLHNRKRVFRKTPSGGTRAYHPVHLMEMGLVDRPATADSSPTHRLRVSTDEDASFSPTTQDEPATNTFDAAAEVI